MTFPADLVDKKVILYHWRCELMLQLVRVCLTMSAKTWITNFIVWTLMHVDANAAQNYKSENKNLLMCCSLLVHKTGFCIVLDAGCKYVANLFGVDTWSPHKWYCTAITMQPVLVVSSCSPLQSHQSTRNYPTIPWELPANITINSGDNNDDCNNWEQLQRRAMVNKFKAPRCSTRTGTHNSWHLVLS